MEDSRYLNILIDWKISFFLSVAKYVISLENTYKWNELKLRET